MRPGVCCARVVAMNTHATSPTSALSHALRENGFVGRLVEPGNLDYDEVRFGWNGAIDRRPAGVAFATDGDDVAAAIRAARSARLEFTIRAGGHSVSGRSVRDDALCIDLRALKAVEVDPERRVVSVGGGALLGELDAATQEHGLAVPAGQISHTGVGGLTLGGGLGWLMRRHGLTIDSLRAAEVVLADGRIVRASENEHADLFWALRGGGGDFGVVTAFRFSLHPVGPAVMAGPVFWAAEDTTDVLRFYRDFAAEAPDELGTVVRLGTVPPLPVIPQHLHWRPAIAVACCYAGELADGERAVQALRRFGTPLVDLRAH